MYFLFFLVLIIALICVHLYICRDYVSVEAQITDAYVERDDDSYIDYITVKYEYDGTVYTANKEWHHRGIKS